MKILLLGSDGQLGGYLRQALARAGDVVASSRAGGADLLPCDLADTSAVAALLRRVRPDVVVNAAAYTAVDKAESDADASRSINAELPRVLSRTLSEWGGALIHYSTDYVFDGTARRPYRESDPTAPLGVYGQSKLEGERAIAEAGINHLILRTAWVYSLRGRNFLTTMLRLGREGNGVRVVGDQHGTPTSAPFLAATTAQLLPAWMDNVETRSGRSGTYHLTAGGATTWAGFAQEIFTTGVSTGMLAQSPAVTAIRTAEYPTPATRPAYSVLDISRIESTFGINVPSWDTELRRLMAASA